MALFFLFVTPPNGSAFAPRGKIDSPLAYSDGKVLIGFSGERELFDKTAVSVGKYNSYELAPEEVYL